MRPHTSRSQKHHAARAGEGSFARIRPGDQLLFRPDTRSGEPSFSITMGVKGSEAKLASDDPHGQVLEVTNIVYDEDEVIGLNVAFPSAGQGPLVFAGAEFAGRDNEPVNLVTILALSALCGAAIWAILTFGL